MKMNWQYIAGFFDGEGSTGCVHRAGNKMGSFYVNMAQTGEEGRQLFFEMAEFLQEQGIKCYFRDKGLVPRSPHVNSTRPLYHLEIQNREGIIMFLKGVMPYVRIKKVKCQDMLRYFKLFPSLRGRISNKRDLDLVKLKLDRATGLTYDQIAAKHGVSTMAVWDRLNPSRAHRLKHHYQQEL